MLIDETSYFLPVKSISRIKFLIIINFSYNIKIVNNIAKLLIPTLVTTIISSIE